MSFRTKLLDHVLTRVNKMTTDEEQLTLYNGGHGYKRNEQEERRSYN